jgi:membrane protease YdiL (CAAX protease family)
MQILFPYIAVALTALVTLFHHTALQRRFGDAAGIWLYFALFFSLLLAVPVLVLAVLTARPLQVLSECGVTSGDFRIGVGIMLVALPVTVLVSHFASRSTELKQWYPFSKQACRSDLSFAVYEIGYLLLYYTAWEFLYRGLLFFPLLARLGFVPAMAITTALSTFHHIGHPKMEIAGSVLVGVLFSAVALLTRSILYPIAIHAMVGISNDTFIYVRNHRPRHGGRENASGRHSGRNNRRRGGESGPGNPS